MVLFFSDTLLLESTGSSGAAIAATGLWPLSFEDLLLLEPQNVPLEFSGCPGAASSDSRAEGTS